MADEAGAVSLRVAAARTVHSVLTAKASLDGLLPAEQRAYPDARDRALLQTLVYGTLRWHERLNSILNAMLERPMRRADAQVATLLEVGLFQLIHLRIPPHATVHATVEAVRALRKPRAVGLVNALLRRATRELAALEELADRTEPGRFAHPQWLIDRLKEDWPDDWKAILEANTQPPPMWIRVNVARQSTSAYQRRLSEAIGLESEPSPYADAALRLQSPVPVQQLPGFAEGEVSVQDAAAQLAAGLLDVEPGMRVLDACAAPGGKGCHILERQPALAELVAVDRSASRLGLMDDNLQRLGLSAVVVNADATEPSSWWDGRMFDRVLLDAPCSATGVIRRHPDIKSRRGAGQIAEAVRRQGLLLERVWPLLAPGGKLLYSTCSMLRQENEQQLKDFLGRPAGAHATPLDLPAAWRVDAAGGGWQILPGQAGMDGFFYACLSKD